MAAADAVSKQLLMFVGNLTCNAACLLMLSLLVCYVSFSLVCPSDLSALFYFTSVTHKFQVLT